MTIGIIGNETEYLKLVSLITKKEINSTKHFNSVSDISENLDVIFDFSYINTNQHISSLKMLNSITFVNDVENVDVPFSRFNGWYGMYEKGLELVLINSEQKSVLENIGLPYFESLNEIGLISARVVSMLINEAYIALDENVSTKDEIDIAMQLGTNYPLGPFAWGEKIGLQKVLDLLTILCKNDATYTPSNALINELNNN
jgi:3-hydroxybutyryl-CoA dehydrogenase